MNTTATTALPGRDLAALAALFLVALAGFDTLFDGRRYLAVGAVALTLGVLLAVLGAWRGWGPLRMAGGLLAVHLLLGSVAIAPEHARWMVVPSRTSLLALIEAPVTSWRTVLAAQPPTGNGAGELAVVWIPMLVLPVIAGSLLLRTGSRVAAWFPTGVAALLPIALGTDKPTMPVVRVVAYAGISIIWLAWGDRPRASPAERDGASRELPTTRTAPPLAHEAPPIREVPVARRQVLGAGVTLVLAGSATMGAAQVLPDGSDGSRHVLRDARVPGFDPRADISPLSRIHGYRTRHGDRKLFTIAPFRVGEKVRSVALDRYDGHVFLVADGRHVGSDSGTFVVAPTAAVPDTTSPSGRRVTVRIHEYDGVWAPTLGGHVQRIEPDTTMDTEGDVYLNAATGTLVFAEGIEAGSQYTVTGVPSREVPPVRSAALTFATPELPPIPGFGSAIGELAAQWIDGAASDLARVQALIAAVQDTCALVSPSDPGTAQPPPGHGWGRLEAMLGLDATSTRADIWRTGTIEQFAALTAVMARSVDIPARVVVGFEVPERPDEPGMITGKDASAWIEVAFADVGWLAFDVVPASRPIGQGSAGATGPSVYAAHGDVERRSPRVDSTIER